MRRKEVGCTTLASPFLLPSVPILLIICGFCSLLPFHLLPARSPLHSISASCFASSTISQAQCRLWRVPVHRDVRMGRVLTHPSTTLRAGTFSFASVRKNFACFLAGIAVDNSTGSVIVCDSSNHRIRRIDRNGNNDDDHDILKRNRHSVFMQNLLSRGEEGVSEQAEQGDRKSNRKWKSEKHRL